MVSVDMKDFVVSSALTRLLANVFIFLSLVVCLFIGAWEIIASQPINPLVYTVISTGMAYSLMLLGVHTGIAMPVASVELSATQEGSTPPTLRAVTKPAGE